MSKLSFRNRELETYLPALDLYTHINNNKHLFGGIDMYSSIPILQSYF